VSEDGYPPSTLLRVEVRNLVECSADDDGVPDPFAEALGRGLEEVINFAEELETPTELTGGEVPFYATALAETLRARIRRGLSL
jgi:hypothetical protein